MAEKKLKFKNIFVTGGAGYVGAVLIPKLLGANYHVKNLDLYIYGENVLRSVKGNPNLKEIKGDIRDKKPTHDLIKLKNGLSEKLYWVDPNPINQLQSVLNQQKRKVILSTPTLIID